MGVSKLHKVIPDFWENPMDHPIWKDTEIQAVKSTHYEPRTSTDRLAFSGLRFVRCARPHAAAAASDASHAAIFPAPPSAPFVLAGVVLKLHLHIEIAAYIYT